ncbi:formate dehydrogenase accessory sulfurtransferase FdhD [Dietzia sp. PP-33]|uniref:formate dehydrogenase accessory sulfurtransferase FdhD n=1 Tax=Dietzia sp. PP-33 TaxID=2957500 RepID=UPI0029AA99F8|nr:formate dehydrogenase accessory sulfurtransferase FdhD [Dietzia sp. PP-33]MDX2357907.1 formate dehydrogenase accessory sulfurtransferase FdhD [Dietzia sp. PP-33]
MGRRTSRHPARRIIAGSDARREVATLAVEEPLEIRLGGRPFVVTMRTPGDDMDLAAGHLVSEGAIWNREHLPEICYCTTVSGRAEQDYNTLTVTLSPDVPEPQSARAGVMSSACGVCGVSSVDDVRRATHFPAESAEPMIDAEILLSLPERLRDGQVVFGRTGGVHAAGLFSPDGELLCLREDVGRHNAVDKVVGWALRDGRLPLRETILQVSGRASFELVQKASMAGIPLLSAVSAPSSLAVDLASETGVTLVGFSRGDRATVYTHPGRLRD